MEGWGWFQKPQEDGRGQVGPERTCGWFGGASGHCLQGRWGLASSSLRAKQ